MDRIRIISPGHQKKSQKNTYRGGNRAQEGAHWGWMWAPTGEA